MFTPMERADQLPRVGDAIEHAVLEFKAPDNDRKYDASTFEMAKDTAAFANHLGGTVIVGAAEQGGYLRTYKGIARAEAARVRTAFCSAVEQRCKPQVTIAPGDFACPGDDGRRVVVINVWPSLNLVGVKAFGGDEPGGAGQPWAFPVRVGTQTKYLEPGELAMYMTPAVRRTVVLLGRIPPQGLIRFKTTNEHSRVAEYALNEVREADNVAIFTRIGAPARSRLWHVPLDRIRTTYLDDDSKWVVVAEL